jgi:hypothetical protein
MRRKTVKYLMNIRVYPCLSVVVFLFAATAFANNTENPYQGIVDRNVFGLRPPPPPPSNEPPKPPIPAINLTGITTILGKKMAFMTIQLPPKAGEQGKPGPTSFMLTEGERDGEIEVVSIDEVAGTVKVNDFGTITNVTFGKLPSTPAPAMAGAPGGIPSPNPIVAPVSGGQRSIPGLPARPMRLGNNQAGMNSGVNPGLVNGQANANLGNGQQNSYGQQSTTPTAADWQAANRSPEENVVLYEANRIKNDELRKAGVNLPRMPQHPWLGGPQGQGQPQPQ